MDVCDYKSCFDCPYPDCIADANEILRHEPHARRIDTHTKVADYTGAAKIIHDLRQRHNLSQRGLAALIGISSTAVGYWETGRHIPSADAWGKLIYHFPEIEAELEKEK